MCWALGAHQAKNTRRVIGFLRALLSGLSLRLSYMIVPDSDWPSLTITFMFLAALKDSKGAQNVHFTFTQLVL